MNGRLLAGCFGVLSVLLAEGCGKPVLRVADPSLGDYYTDREFKKLRKEQRNEYCDEMAQQDSSYVAAIADLRETLAGIETRRTRLAEDLDSLGAVRDTLTSRLAQAESWSGPGRGSAPPVGDRRVRSQGVAVLHHRVRPGDSLWEISARADVYGDGRDWRRIYEANRGAIRDPDLIHPGQELRIPR